MSQAESAASFEDALTRSRKRTLAMFLKTYEKGKGGGPDQESHRLKVAGKMRGDFGASEAQARKRAAYAMREGRVPSADAKPTDVHAAAEGAKSGPGGVAATLSEIERSKSAREAKSGKSLSLVVQPGAGTGDASTQMAARPVSRALTARRKPKHVPTPEWHAPWKLARVVSGHLGWVRAIAFDSSNEWFATGGADRTIKIWDVASNRLKLTLTGHIHGVRGLDVSSRHPYLFSCGEDKQVKCWDLETNQVVRDYYGHLSGVYCLSVHPTLDLVMTGGRDGSVRVWDMRTRREVHTLVGHKSAVYSVATQSLDPQVISGSMDNTLRLWDLAAGKVRSVLTHHKKGVRSCIFHPREMSFMSGAADNIKKWQLPEGQFLRNFRGHNAIINTLALNQDNVVVSGADNGSMRFWDYTTGYCFQKLDTIVQPGSLDSEAGIFASSFDRSGSRFFTCEADKTIKVYKEDETATPETHPIDMEAWRKEVQSFRRY